MTTDHAGANWTTVPGEILSGEHINVGTFYIPSGVNYVETGVPFAVYAKEAVINGALNAVGNGYPGGDQSNGAGPGGGYKGSTNSVGAGGGGYGNTGGHGKNASGNLGAGGVPYGVHNDVVNEMGSGGAGGSSGFGTWSRGAAGGGAVTICADIVRGNGGIYCDGNSNHAVVNSPGAGGSGGGILIICNTLTCDDLMFLASGGFGTCGFNDTCCSGGGAGGRIEFEYTHTDIDPLTKSTADGGLAGGGAATGGVGTIQHNAELGEVHSVWPVGQDFCFNMVGSVVLTKVTLKVPAHIACDVTLTVYQDSSKSVSLGNVTTTVNTNGEVDWVFANPIELSDGTHTYFMELTVLSNYAMFVFSCTNKFNDYIYTHTGFVVTGVSLYMKLYIYSHVINPVIYNIDDTSTKCYVANKVLTGASHQINANGTGHIHYEDDFTTSKFVGDRLSVNGETYDTTNNLLYLVTGGHVAYKLDCKFPIIGVPIISSLININDETVIQIAKDVNGSPGVWYNISQEISSFSNQWTRRGLDCSNLHVEGKTILYFRIKNISGDTWIHQFFIDINTDTTSAQTLMMPANMISTFQIDQMSSSSINCAVELIQSDCKY